MSQEPTNPSNANRQEAIRAAILAVAVAVDPKHDKPELYDQRADLLILLEGMKLEILSLHHDRESFERENARLRTLLEAASNGGGGA